MHVSKFCVSLARLVVMKNFGVDDRHGRLCAFSFVLSNTNLFQQVLGLESKHGVSV